MNIQRTEMLLNFLSETRMLLGETERQQGIENIVFRITDALEKELDTNPAENEKEPSEGESVAIDSTYNVGDRVFVEGAGVVTLKRRRRDMDCASLNGKAWKVKEVFGWLREGDFRPATKEEVFWLDTVGRESVPDFKEGDAYLDKWGNVVSIRTKEDVKEAIKRYRQRKFSGLLLKVDEKSVWARLTDY